MSRELLRRALASLEESLDTVEAEFAADWRHGIPTREKQLDRMEGMIVEHKSVIDDIRAALEKPEPVECGQLLVIHKDYLADFEQMAEGKYRLLAEKIDD